MYDWKHQPDQLGVFEGSERRTEKPTVGEKKLWQDVCFTSADFLNNKFMKFSSTLTLI